MPTKTYKSKSGETRTYTYDYPWKKTEERKLWIALPKKYVETAETTKYHTTNDYRWRPSLGLKLANEVTPWEWYRMPDDVYLNKIYPTCSTCKQKYVPRKGYNKCFRCAFIE